MREKLQKNQTVLCVVLPHPFSRFLMPIAGAFSYSEVVRFLASGFEASFPSDALS